MLDVIIDTLLDVVKLLPFLYITYVFMEYIEHKMTDKNKEIIEKSGKAGPLFGGLLGMIPQCGFSAAGSNLYVGRIITIGTLIAVYLSTSDEMLPILISEKVSIISVIKIIAIKALIGIIAGFIIDLVLRNLQYDINNQPLLLLYRFLRETLYSLSCVIDKYVMEKKFGSVYEIIFPNGVISFLFFIIFAFLLFKFIIFLFSFSIYLFFFFLDRIRLTSLLY